MQGKNLCVVRWAALSLPYLAQCIETCPVWLCDRDFLPWYRFFRVWLAIHRSWRPRCGRHEWSISNTKGHLKRQRLMDVAGRGCVCLLLPWCISVSPGGTCVDLKSNASARRVTAKEIVIVLIQRVLSEMVYLRWRPRKQDSCSTALCLDEDIYRLECIRETFSECYSYRFPWCSSIRDRTILAFSWPAVYLCDDVWWNRRCFASSLSVLLHLDTIWWWSLSHCQGSTRLKTLNENNRGFVSFPFISLTAS